MLVHDKRTSKPRGYAFIEYEHERDMHCKYSFRIISRLVVTEIVGIPVKPAIAFTVQLTVAPPIIV